ncbi:alanine--tRNA ligase [uncultured Ruminococcus sp.]|uniref:alanine--tRNA ligase n=1 Tax=uncultured Ruminococcus sp. TaxID=165186 RepID=UPI002601E95D|nr:alanine--tRNA ligase [uncultured Ruminococcus sp.]
MKWQGVNELREKYLSFFESKGHTRLPSFSLIPQGDKSLLLINSGMAPLKKYFLGQAVPPNTRVTTCQKCIRTPDIERVGQTARHGTYFEMLGNFSFGDYFKIEAISWAWEFFTKVLEMPEDKLYVSVFENDDEAYDMWTQKIGVSPEHMVRLGREDNFWEHGSGPCGPCSEIYFDRGPEKGCGKPDCKVGCDCDRYVEVWNLVFSQFDSDGNGHYTEMEHKNIDTGMGLERLACVMQGVDNLFEVDTVQNIMKHVCRIANVTYGADEKTDVALRVITDHIRSTTFMIGDGVMPSNAGRGYVLRRLLRRAARYGRLIGIEKPFLYEVVETVIQENACAYPELEEKKAYIRKIVEEEEKTFAKTIDKGFDMLSGILEQLKAEGNTMVSGEDAFKLSDTYGFPIDLTEEIAAEQGVSVDRERFTALVNEQRTRAREDYMNKAGSSWADGGVQIDAPATVFTGYTHTAEEDAKVVAIFRDSQPIEAAAEGEPVVIVLDKTPFYAESGGQIGDSGVISTPESTFQAETTSKTEDGHFLHLGVMTEGELRVGDTVSARINAEKRAKTMRNHTAAHLLQAALRTVLGDHVHQAGQLVTDSRCRFDFSHFTAMTHEEIKQVEAIVNEKILAAIPVVTQELPIEEARKIGAMALFGEKYGDIVRVVSVENYSVEFCGGTHVDNTAKLGLFRILSESSVASGVRRIEAVTGTGVLELLASYEETMASAAKAMKLSNTTDLAAHCASLVAENKEKDRQIESLNQKISDAKMAAIFDSAKVISGVKIVSAMLNGTTPQVLRKMGDNIKDMKEPVVAVLASVNGEKGNLVCACSAAAREKGAHAGKIVQRVAAVTGGKGGGKPDSAMAGVGKTYMVDEALMALEGIVKEFI